MGKKNAADKFQMEMLYLDNLMLEEHFVRKLEKVIDLDFIYELVIDLYSPYGRESIDPFVLIRLDIIQYIFGIRSMCQINQSGRSERCVSVVYRLWKNCLTPLLFRLFVSIFEVLEEIYNEIVMAS